ncbi:BlaI/MecI/CopY family transcriptional regulator [Nakamurella flava]|uniref:BlaI/MecI/CopY family transcriptional regulator n=1 Tax=Nakamurella flava TaxID=2576308 RepID=UPI001F0CF3B1|nr:BlaI/MecI/CopY family transcriptional regulator [Nakamurella flava]
MTTQRGELERAVVEVLWAADEPLTARAVADHLAGRDLAVTTVLTVLSRLEGKGVVERIRDGRAHTYRAVSSREEHTATLMQQVLDTAGDRSAALARFVGGVSASDAEALRQALEGR